MPLFSIASLIGNAWLDKIKEAYFIMNQISDDNSIAIKLLQDIRAFLASHVADRIHSETLVNALINTEGGDWTDYRNGKPLNTNNNKKNSSAHWQLGSATGPPH